MAQYPSGILPHLKAEEELDRQFFKEDAAYEPPCMCFLTQDSKRSTNCEQMNRRSSRDCRHMCR